MPAAARSLAYPSYRRYWLAAAVSFTCWMMQNTARGWLTLQLTNSPLMVGTVMAVANLPMLIFAVWGGVLADRFNRVRQVMLNEAFIAVTSSALVILLTTGWLQVWHIFVIAFLSGTTFALGLPARQALLPNLVERRDMANAVAMGAAVLAMAQVVGPAIAGFLISGIGMAPTFMVTAALVVPAQLLYARVRPFRGQETPPRANVWHNLTAGFGYVRRSGTVLALVMMGAAGTVFGMSYGTFVPVIARDYLHVGADGLGILLGAGGVGALCGAVAVAFFSDARRWFPLLLTISLGLGADIALFALSPWFALSLGFAFIAGFMQQSFFTSNQTLIQMVAADEMRGRVMSIRVIVFGLAPVGQFLIGGLAQGIGTPLALALAGSLCALLMTSLLLASPALRRL